MPQLALCFTGHVREYAGAARRHHLAREELKRASGMDVDSFLSVHASSQHSSQEMRALANVSAKASEFYSMEESRCRPRCKSFTNVCAFYFQYHGILRAYRMMIDHEIAQRITYDYVARIRWDVTCTHWGFLSRYFAATKGDNHSTSSTFIGSARTWPGQQRKSHDFLDLAWVGSRASAEATMTAVDEYDNDGCGRRLVNRTLLHQECNTVKESKDNSLWFFECILLVRLRRLHPSTRTYGPSAALAPRAWKCSKRTTESFFHYHAG